IESAYRDGVRLFLELGPGASCSRMIGRILGDRPHLARSACFAGQDQISVVLKMMANLIAERVPVDLSPLYDLPRVAGADERKSATIRVVLGGAPFQPPRPPAAHNSHNSHTSHASNGNYGTNAKKPAAPASDSLIQELVRSQQARTEAHAAFLAVGETVTRSMAQALALEMSLRQALGDDASLPPAGGGWEGGSIAFNRDLCFEFARGSVGR